MKDRMSFTQEITIGYNKVAKIGDIVYFIQEDEFDDSELLAEGTIKNIATTPICEIVYVISNGIVSEYNPILLFSTREQLVESYILTLSRRTEIKKQCQKNLADELFNIQNEICELTAEIHELKKEIGADNE
jgi:hypothetical protein